MGLPWRLGRLRWVPFSTFLTDFPVTGSMNLSPTATPAAASFLALFVGGPLWEPKGFNEDGSPPAEQVASSTQSTPAFGFVPTPTERAQANGALRGQ